MDFSELKVNDLNKKEQPSEYLRKEYFIMKETQK